jgi:hypothetical protein
LEEVNDQLAAVSVFRAKRSECVHLLLVVLLRIEE